MDALRQHVSSSVLSALSSHGVSLSSKATLAVDASLSGALSLGVEPAALRGAGVERIVALGDVAQVAPGARLVVVLRATLQGAQRVARWLQSAPDAPPAALLFVPRRSLVCERVFADAGLAARVRIDELPLDLLPLDDDVLSLELGAPAFADLFLHKDPSCLYTIAKALMKFQALHGIIPKIIGKGTNAESLANLLLRMRRELDTTTGEDSSGSSLAPAKASPFDVFPAKMDFDSIVILDRTVDLVTPLCMELTYEGLVDEVFGIQTTFIQVNEAYITAPQAQQSASSATSPHKLPSQPNAPIKTKKVSLNPATDKLFVQLRDLNFAVVGGVLAANARRIQEDIDRRHDAKTISEIKDFIGKLGGLEGEKAYLKLHTNISEEITKKTQDPDFNRFLELQQNILSGNQQNSQLDYIEEMIDKQAPLLNTLRIMALYSVVCGGIKAKTYDYLKREFVQTYGIEHLLTLQNLESASLLSSSLHSSAFETPLSTTITTSTTAASVAASKPTYANLRKPLAVIVDDIDDQNPADVAYVHSGYAPVSVRLVEAATGCGRFAPVVAGLGAKVSVGGSRGGWAGVAARGLTLSGEQLNGGSASPGRGKGVKERKVSWEGLEEVLKVVPGGPSFEIDQVLPDPNFVLRNEKEKKTTLVLYLGGCTSTEISSLRFLSRGKGARQFVTMTTSMITGTRLIESLVEVVAERRPMDMN
ncbi:hypothetical protein HDU98_001178 [Podochytrium sp. JEL0797]|nr:hypothetical protein HDU98_001178 [Podochytrium sp. JEL0797]